MGKTTTTTNELLLDPKQQAEQEAGDITQGSLRELASLVGQGPGARDVQADLNARRAAGRDFGPTGADVNSARGFAEQMFQGQQAQLNQQFQQQGVDSNRQAALSGRGGNDPILQAKLAQQQIGQQSILEGQKSSFTAQQSNQNFRGRLDMLQGLASQALSNRQSLNQIGAANLGAERAFRIGTATQRTTEEKPFDIGSVLGGITGAVGAIAGVPGIGGIFGGGGGAKDSASTALDRSSNIAMPTAPTSLPFRSGGRGGSGASGGW